MPAPNFSSRLNSVLSPGGSEPFLKAFDSLRAIAVDLSAWLRNSPDDGAAVQVEPGFPAKMGQQFNLVVRVPSKNVADTLFRAYVDNGGRVSLDFFGDQPQIAADEDELNTLVLDFLARPEVKARMNVYKQLAS